MGKVLVFGHKSPDTDAICSAIAFADLKNKLGEDVEAVRLGDLNGETDYVLKHFQIEAPRLVKTVANEVPAVYLIDHNERAQSADDIENVDVLSVVDHHRIANFETKAPLYYRAEPVGCTATIINKLYKEAGVPVAKTIAGIMLSSIISDTLLFKSPTCTEEDVKAAKELETISGIDAQTYGLDMLKAGTNIADKSAEELISIDVKPFKMGKYAVEIAQVNVVDTDDALSRQVELETAINKEIDAKNLDLFVLAVTNILTSDSAALILGKAATAAESAFKVTLDNNVATLKGVVSRKKQIVPVLTEELTK
ncbi:manganese-dependent inorganic pyrophosphatase [Sporolactobacillus shoreicorticis]|uniref:Probable manganese-dependent inorganic pyrophosphatase n=1 Tax=Sporolactobacillus shoreicorticis TaxID=1923877 RepID=A0ABW5S3G8_9BACL|nr:manganese-dependent inorganic pyrophosphatase [Sporolactobacillus shoreicorticis]MCO7127638.1 manganese-dependent inorganic pyrophosphatase [Sporolactobacillus shoreicorticis]